MKANAAQVRGIVDAVDARYRFFLFHGPDEAGADELARRLIRAVGADVERIDLDTRDLKSQPGRLADEAASLSLFGGARVILVRDIDDACVEAVALLLHAEKAGNPVVATGPSLKTASKLVKQAIAASNAVAHACYIPEGADAVRLTNMIAREQGLRLSNDVALRLTAACGGDRAVLGREVEKLALYLDAAVDRPRDADAAALDAIGADLGEVELSHAIDAVVDGRIGDVGSEVSRLFESGGSAIPLLRQLSKRLISLAEMRADIDAGGDPAGVIERHRVFFKERGATARALNLWSSPQLVRAIERVREAERAMMHSASAGEVLAEAECTALARVAARSRSVRR